MSRVRQRDTTPELRLRRALFASGCRYRTCDRSLPGSPDIVFWKARLAVFVHGCFWHRHKNCPKASEPRANADFWQKKFSRNTERDKQVEAALRTLGWEVVVVWECELKSDDAVLTRVHAIKELLAK